MNKKSGEPAGLKLFWLNYQILRYRKLIANGLRVWVPKYSRKSSLMLHEKQRVIIQHKPEHVRKPNAQLNGYVTRYVNHLNLALDGQLVMDVSIKVEQ